MTPSLLRLATATLLLIVAACSGETPKPAALPIGQMFARGVIHLDPRLENGSSPAKELGERTKVVREWSFVGQTELPQEWELASGKLRGVGANGGLLIEADAADQNAPILGLQYGIDPEMVDMIEVDVAMANSGRSTIAWRRPKPLSSGFVATLSDGAATPQTLRFSFLGHRSWTDSIDGLALRLSSNRKQDFELMAIRFVHQPFVWGPSPLDPEGATSGDAGLIVIDGMAARAWPARIGSDLICSVVVPLGGKLSVQVARGRNATALDLEARYSVRSLDEDGAASSGSQSLRIGDKGWHAVIMGLNSFEGEEVEIKFSVHAKGKAPAPKSIRADALFGAPMVLGTLSEDRRPNILLVTLDTLRYDALGSSQRSQAKPARIQTTFLDSLAKNSFVFDSAWSAGNSTQPSHASILTGVSIQDHSLVDNYGVLADGNTTLAERLRTAGYQTAAVTCQRAIGPAAGFGQGFDLFIPAEAVSGADGRLAINRARAWLEQWRGEGDRPFFLWVHVCEPHTPYDLPGNDMATYEAKAGSAPDRKANPPTLPNVSVIPPELAFLGDITSRDLVNYLYHAEVSYTDALMADLFGTLEDANQMQHTLSFVTADHGEFLGERGNFYNHRGLFPETLHVPLLMTLPGQKDGVRVAARVTNRDIVPTVLSQLGLSEVNPIRDLVAVADGSAQAGDRRLWFAHANDLQIACRDDDYHFITTLRDGFRFGLSPTGPNGIVVAKNIPVGTHFLYDWKADPSLVNNLAEEKPELVAKYLKALADYRESARPVGRQAREISTAEAADLEALGYTGD